MIVSLPTLSRKLAAAATARSVPYLISGVHTSDWFSNSAWVSVGKVPPLSPNHPGRAWPGLPSTSFGSVVIGLSLVFLDFQRLFLPWPLLLCLQTCSGSSQPNAPPFDPADALWGLVSKGPQEACTGEYNLIGIPPRSFVYILSTGAFALQQ